MAETATAQNKEITELQGEFVSGSGYYSSTAEILYHGSTDYLQPNFDAEIARKMRYDSEVNSSVEYLTNAVFSEGMQPVSPVTDENDPEFALAQEIADFIRQATIPASRSVAVVAWELFVGCYFNGFKAAEIVLKLNADDDLILDRLNVKSNDSIAFAVDKFKNVLGIAGMTEKGFPTRLTDENIIRRDKFLIFQFELEDNDPRGVKKILSAVDAYCDKKDTKAKWREWLKRVAIPQKFGTTAPNAREVEVRDQNGQKLLNQDGSPQTMSAERAMLKGLEGFANNSAMVGPHGSDLKQLEVTGTGQQFTNSAKFSNSEIRKSVLGDSLVTGEADKDARAARESAMGVVDLRLVWFRLLTSEAVRRDLYQLLTVLKFGEDKAHLTPYCNMGGTENRTWEQTAQALSSIGYQMADEHMREGDQMLGFTPRDKDAAAEPEKINAPLNGSSEEDDE